MSVILCATSFAFAQTKAIKLAVLDPGHFHAALVQKTMYASIDPKVEVFAPNGPEYLAYKEKISSYNSRADSPTSWTLEEHLSDDFLSDFIKNSKANVVVLSGNNQKKTRYIYEAVKKGVNVFADKPMAITQEDYKLLLSAFDLAKSKGVVIYDIMTERFEITTMLQKYFSTNIDLFGELLKGSEDNPSIVKESVHNYSKQVSGATLVRPQWFFDVHQQGEGIVDVTTHLLDLVMWECFPDKAILKSNVGKISASKWPTMLTPDQFMKVTNTKAIPQYLQDRIGKDGNLYIECNGEITTEIDGVWSKVGVIWAYEAPPGGGDTHYSIMKGSKADLIIKQGADQDFVPQLYIVNKGGNEFANRLKKGVEEANHKYPGISFTMDGMNNATITIPSSYRNGHESHFGQVTENFVKYLSEGKLPAWEVDNMKTKYYISTTASMIAE